MAHPEYGIEIQNFRCGHRGFAPAVAEETPARRCSSLDDLDIAISKRWFPLKDPLKPSPEFA